VISVALIVASIAISNQMTFLRTKDLDFQKDQQLVIPLRTSTAKNILTSLKTELLSNSAIVSVGDSIYYPGITNTIDWLLYKQGKLANQTKQVYVNFVDETFLSTMGINPVAGRLFSREFPADTNRRIILNEQAIRQFDFASPVDAIGKTIAANWGTQPTFYHCRGSKRFPF
jgi:putative ABC transport system permease protein